MRQKISLPSLSELSAAWGNHGADLPPSPALPSFTCVLCLLLCSPASAGHSRGDITGFAQGLSATLGSRKMGGTIQGLNWEQGHGANWEQGRGTNWEQQVCCPTTDR